MFSAEAKDLINGIFVADPARRYKVEDVLKHPWTRGDTMPQPAVHSEMRGRRARILADKGLSLEAEEAALAAAAAAAAALTAGGAGAGVGVGSTPMTMTMAMAMPGGSTASAASSASASAAGSSALAGMSMDDAATSMLPVDAFGLGLGMGMGLGMAGDDGGDAFARSASRSAKVAAPEPIALPASHPTFLVLPAARPGAAAPAAAAAAAVPEAGAAASAAPESAEAALERLAAAAASAGIAIDDDVSCSAADAASGGRLTAFTLAGVSTAAAARAIAGALASGLGASVAAKTHEGEEGGAAPAAGKSVKLRAALPGGLRVDVRFLRPAAGADAGDAAGVIVDFQRTAGDVLTFNRAFARTAAALAPAIAPASA